MEDKKEMDVSSVKDLSACLIEARRVIDLQKQKIDLLEQIVKLQEIKIDLLDKNS